MAVASSASVSQIIAVSTTSAAARSSRRSKSVVSFGLKKLSHGFHCGCSSSTFFTSEAPVSVVQFNAERAASKPVCVQAMEHQQNVDLPPSFVSKREKKPYVKPIQHGSHQKRMRRRERKQLPPKILKAPSNGMLVERLVPLAHSVYEAYLVVLDGVSRLLKQLPIKACRWCTEVHIGELGHGIKTCQGKHSTGRFGEHLWVPGYLDDVVVPLEAFHLVDRLQKPIKHEERFKHDRIPAIVELCIQAGLDLPEFPTLRRTEPVDRWLHQAAGHEQQATLDPSDDIRKLDRIDMREYETNASASGGGGEEEEEEEPSVQTMRSEQREPTSTSKYEDLRISDEDDLKTVAEKTLRAWEKMRAGAMKLMQTYPVRACGYCPEVHIGRRGHKLQLCGAFKHQWRNGQHGWQDAALDDLIPPRFVWHVRDKNEPALKNELAKYYGKAPAVVELCVQAGAAIPRKYKAFMRLDIIIPDLDELEMVA